MINGAILRDAIISGANSIQNQKQLVDSLNIFPVPDGDTGTNMSMTMSSARTELLKLTGEEDVSTVAKQAGSALLRGARGNSGVILSLLFRGFSKGLKGVDEADGAAMANALSLGVDAAYKAVMKPTEGTILTVARVAAEHAKAAAGYNNDARYVWDEICDAAEAALATTPDLLPVLKRAGVVDAGGQGLCYIFRGMQSVFNDGAIVTCENKAVRTVDVDSFESAVRQYDGDTGFAYNVELTIEKAEGSEADSLRDYLDTIGGSVVVVEDDKIIKAHVHTDNPGDAVTRATSVGKITSTVITNTADAQPEVEEEAHAKKALERVEPEVGAVGFVAVAAGNGLCSLFNDLGCLNVVTGGQTMNPSTEDILEAILATPAETVFVLPNNKNIIMAAEQAVPMADRKVIIVPTRTIPQGLSAMLAYDPDASEETNKDTMIAAAGNVGTGSITYAARDSEFDNKKIKEGDILALQNGKLVFTEKDINKAAVKLTRQMVNRDTNFVTLIYGADVSDEQAEAARSVLESKLSSTIEVTLVNGGQPVYYYLISIEQ